MRVKRTERGWGGHFIGAASCRFRRNTLLECGEQRIVVSTVGNYHNVSNNGAVDILGANGRYYETMAFKAKMEGSYWEANVSEKLSFNSEWAICAESTDKLPIDVDNKADQMHETVVTELSAKMLLKEL